jgi:Holliday junction DNA helicase RuvA
VIAHLAGTVAHRDATSVVVDVGGVGYLVHVTPADDVPAVGQPVRLHTSLQVREESMTLYGFTSPASLRLFELLLTSSGVGPKLALAALATHQPDVLRVAIAGADLATLTAVPGIGRKVAERLVLELKDKVGSVGAAIDPVSVAAGDGAPSGDHIDEVRDALLGLGYSSAEVQRALARIDEPAADTAVLLRDALRVLGGTAAGVSR